MRRRILCVLLLAVVAVLPAFAQLGIRNISSLSVDADFDGRLSIDLNQVLLFSLAPQLSGEVSIQRRDDSRGLRKTTVSMAPILLVGDAYYVIFRYGLGIGDVGAPPAEAEDERAISHSLAIDANRETSSLYLNLALRGEYYPVDNFWFVLPTVAARLPIVEGVDLLGRYLFSYSSSARIGNALLAEVSSALNNQLSVKGGLTATLDSIPAEEAGGSRNAEWSMTGIAGISYRINPDLSLRYQVEYLGVFGDTDGVRNTLVLDASF